MAKRTPIVLGLMLLFISIWLLMTQNGSVRLLLDRLDQAGYDLQLKTRLMSSTKPVIGPIAIVDIDDKSLQVEGRWPWSRGKLATLVEKLYQQGAEVVAFDVFFSEQENNIAELVMDKLAKKNLLQSMVQLELNKFRHEFDEDAIFATAIKNHNVVLALGFIPRKETHNLLPQPLLTLTPQQDQQLDILHAEGYISNIPILQDAAKGSGFINSFSDNDGIIRRAPLIIAYHDKVYPSLALQAALQFLAEPVSLITPSYGDSEKLEGLQIGMNTIIPTDASGKVIIPFVGYSFSFPYYSATEILQDKLPAQTLSGKIVFVGTSAMGLGDLQATAIESPFPGVEIQATIANGILLNNFSYKPAWTQGAKLILTLLFGTLAAIWFPFLGPRLLGLLIIILPLLAITINNWIWIYTGLIISIFIPLLLVLLIAFVNIVYGYLFETRHREKLREIFGQYVPSKHIDEMMKSKAGYAMHGESRSMSVLFADIRNFTSISEQLTASELADMLNTFLTPMTEIIFQKKGTIDKYIGDLIMAFWGAPLVDKFHAAHAIAAAIMMQKKLAELREQWLQKNWPAIYIGIGINSGLMSVGDMGSKYRRNYTVLGDAVNLASRVESLTKYYGVGIIITEYTKDKQSQFLFRTLDKVKVKGKKQGVLLYEVIGFKNEVHENLQQEVELFEQLIDAYFKKQWLTAQQILMSLTEMPNQKLFKLYQARITTFMQTPPPDDWDGVFEHTEK